MMYELVIMFMMQNGELEFNLQRKFHTEEACEVAKETYSQAAINMVAEMKDRYKASFTTCVPSNKRSKEDVFKKVYEENLLTNLVRYRVIK